MSKWIHKEIDRAIASLRAVDLDDLGRRLHDLHELNVRNPSRPDGYPSSTPGAPVPSASAPPPLSDDDEDEGPVDLTSVEAAALARGDHNDPMQRSEYHARQSVRDAAADLAVALAHLAKTEAHRRPPATPAGGCWVMGRVGGWDEAYCSSDLHEFLAKALDKPQTFGRWAYDFVRRNGRLPTLDERRAHQNGDKVVPAA
jgi:hypothetical protein